MGRDRAREGLLRAFLRKRVKMEVLKSEQQQPVDRAGQKPRYGRIKVDQVDFPWTITTMRTLEAGKYQL